MPTIVSDEAMSKVSPVRATFMNVFPRDRNYFKSSDVYRLNSFLVQCASLGVGTVWMDANLNNWQRYQSLGLDFPTVTAPSI